MENLKKETEKILREICKDERDIKFIGSKCGWFSCSWDKFCELADREYHAGAGSHQVHLDLVIVFYDNSWLARGEYDGSEWWEHIELPVKKDAFVSEIDNIFKDELGNYTFNTRNK